MKNIYTEMLKTNISENLIQFQLIKSWKTNALGEKDALKVLMKLNYWNMEIVVEKLTWSKFWLEKVIVVKNFVMEDSQMTNF